MFSTMLDPATRLYILVPDFNPLIEQYTRGDGDRGHRGLPGLVMPRGQAPTPMRPCGLDASRGFPCGEAPGVRRPGPWRSRAASVES